MAHPGSGGPWDWRTLGVMDPGSGGPLGVADPNRKYWSGSQKRKLAKDRGGSEDAAKSV